MTRVIAAILGLVVAHATAQAIQVALDPRAVTEAVAIGQSRIERDRVRFHAPYRLAVNTPPVDFVDVITPFRRIVLLAESHAQIGDRSFGQRQALEFLAAAPPDVEIQVELTFHPLNTYVGVPEYLVALVARGAAPITPRTIERLPRHGARVGGSTLPAAVPGGLIVPKDSEPMLGGTVVARFDVRTIEPRSEYDVVVTESGKELARVRASFERMR